ncbi:hypothetical protein BC834DRAFT_670888 [Gloeopeniophorella convolvens]|nr:hypothetical protein BC834DRAFT_670888 [Gloeopeniophorella convolvens]
MMAHAVLHAPPRGCSVLFSLSMPTLSSKVRTASAPRKNNRGHSENLYDFGVVLSRGSARAAATAAEKKFKDADKACERTLSTPKSKRAGLIPAADEPLVTDGGFSSLNLDLPATSTPDPDRGTCPSPHSFPASLVVPAMRPYADVPCPDDPKHDSAATYRRLRTLVLDSARIVPHGAADEKDAYLWAGQLTEHLVPSIFLLVDASR